MKKQKNFAKKVFVSSLSVLFLLFAAVQLALAQGGWNMGNYSQTGLPRASVADIIRNFAMWLLMVFGFIAIIGFVISGILYLVSAGDEKRQEQAKKAMIYSIMGVIVGLIGLVVIFAVDYFLRGGGTSYYIFGS